MPLRLNQSSRANPYDIPTVEGFALASSALLVHSGVAKDSRVQRQMPS